MKTTQQYTTPEVEIVEMSVEMGFAATGEASGDIVDTGGGSGPVDDDN